MAVANEAWRIPTLVQQLAASAHEPPSRYVRREQGTLAAGGAADMPEPIPAIDLSRLLSPAYGAEEVSKLRSALQAWGLFVVTNHGIEASLMDHVMRASKEFFLQPLQEKQRCSNLVDGKHFQVQGYGNDQVKTQDQILDWSDRLHLRVEPEDESNLNIWPKHPEGFRDVLCEYALKSKRIKNVILEAMAKLLDLDSDYFLNQFSEKAPVTVRINHYLTCPRPDLVLGFKPHSDDGVLATLLVDNDLVALQVFRDGMWYNVPTKPHTMLVNIGDFMEVMSNGTFKSPVHKVVANAAEERISLALFYGLDPEQEISPAADLLRNKQPALYSKVKIKDCMAGFYEHFARGTRVIDSIKI